MDRPRLERIKVGKVPVVVSERPLTSTFCDREVQVLRTTCQIKPPVDRHSHVHAKLSPASGRLADLPNLRSDRLVCTRLARGGYS
jgi:hypothetical protein